MLYNLYSAIKTELAKEAFLKTITWFNNQYEEGMVVDTSAFIEFNDDIVNNLLTKDKQRVDLPFRVHYVKKITANKAGTIPETQIQAFDTEAVNVIKRLKGHMLVNTAGDNLCEGVLRFVKIKSFQRQAGWQAWYIDFFTKVDIAKLLV